MQRRTTLTRGNGTTRSWSYDAVSRITQLAEDLSSTTHDLTLGFTYNPASQIASNTRSNDAYAWTSHYGVTRSYSVNGLNQYTAVGGVTPTYDSRGNLISAGSTTYGYNSENRLTSASGGVTLGYDPAMRLYQTSDGTVTTRFLYDGGTGSGSGLPTMIAEYNGSNGLLRRYVHGPGEPAPAEAGEPLVWYEGTGTSDRRWLHADERGSIIAISNDSGTVISVNTYDEYGIPGSTNTGRFQYTGQAWLPELGMYHYRSRIYSPTLGRFLQTDPLRYRGGMNLYAYVGNDPVNFIDPLGLRPMNGIEIWLAQQSGFGNLIDYSRIDIRFLDTINDRAYVLSDQAIVFDPDRHWREYYFDLIHELTHILQMQQGVFSWWDLLMNQALHRFREEDLYRIDPSISFDQHNPEGQAEIVEQCARQDVTACQLLQGNGLGIAMDLGQNPYDAVNDLLFWLSVRGRPRSGTVTVTCEEPEDTC